MLDRLAKSFAERRAQSYDRGASAVEYGLLVAGIAALIVIAIFALGPVVKGAFDSTCHAVSHSGSMGDGTSCG